VNIIANLGSPKRLFGSVAISFLIAGCSGAASSFVSQSHGFEGTTPTQSVSPRRKTSSRALGNTWYVNGVSGDDHNNCGKYLTVTDQEASAIYRYAVSGTNATLKGTVSLSGATDCAATWIARPYVYCADAGNDDGEVFKYPAGGSSIATLSGMDFPFGVVSARVR
jgi:hypothetical protein